MNVEIGKTWWGKRWLSSLLDIDYNTRIPRGKDYAERGAVHNLQFFSDGIKAQVKGSRTAPYHLSLRLPLFGADVKARLLKDLNENISFLAPFLNKELSRTWIEQLERKGLHLFPRKWEDLELNCDCPDWAHPCKHTAALIYHLASVFDRAPEMLFYFRGFDINELLPKMGYPVPPKSWLNIPLIVFKPTQPSVASFRPTAPLFFEKRIEILQAPQQILQLLSPQPLFFPKSDFREVLFQNYRQVAQAMLKEPDKSLFSKSAQWSEDMEGIQVSVDDHLLLRQVKLFRGTEVIPAIPRPDLECLIEELKQLDAENLEKYPISVQALFCHYQFVRYLIKNGAYRPQVMALDSQKFRIIWTPAFQFDLVREGVNQLAKDFPMPILNCYSRQGTKWAATEEQSIYLISLFLNHYIAKYALRPASPQMPWIYRFFFRQLLVPVDDLEAVLITENISVWLSPIASREENIHFFVRIEDVEKGSRKKLSLYAKIAGDKYLMDQEGLLGANPKMALILLQQWHQLRCRFSIFEKLFPKFGQSVILEWPEYQHLRSKWAELGLNSIMEWLEMN